MNKLAPLPSPEKPPATNYAVVRSVPLSVSPTRGPLPSVVAAQAGVQRGPRRVLGRASTCSRAAVLSDRPNSGFDLFLICFAVLFHIFVLIFKNMYLLAGRSKCYGSNFVEFMIMSSI